jgi:hypothetical protein
LQAAIRESAKSLGLATADLPSLAGHDAQEIARIAPMAMIFVPSEGGISHSPKEFTPWQDVPTAAKSSTGRYCCWTDYWTGNDCSVCIPELQLKSCNSNISPVHAFHAAIRNLR